MVVNIRVCRVSVGCSKQELCKSESILLTDQFLWNKLVIHACQDNFLRKLNYFIPLGVSSCENHPLMTKAVCC